ncbi:MAG: UbiA family prenyltransferase [Candidatus Eremiobacteraeota bacterium]|nr:UbiA family prenyltransferase [Candidatus Eremiobacteraeota bacterium]MCW5869509.1 UbiA family prenyltransferase [Candidatus Eremiobacteraeota bacterium]
MRQVLCRLAYSNLWIAFNAAGQAYVNCLLLKISAPTACWLCGLSMFFVYTFAKTVRFDPQADMANDPERMEFLMRWRWPLVATASLGFLHGLCLTRADGPRALLFTFALLGAVLYDVKWLPRGFRYRRLKDITGVKSLVVAIIWGVQTAALPASDAGLDLLDPAVLALILYGSLSMFINTVYFDIGDMKGDRLEGVITLPLHWGLRGTVQRLHLVNLLMALWLALLWRWGLVGQAALWLSPMVAFVWLFLRQARNEDSDLGFWCDVIVDGTYVFFALWLALPALLGWI